MEALAMTDTATARRHINEARSLDLSKFPLAYHLAVTHLCADLTSALEEIERLRAREKAMRGPAQMNASALTTEGDGKNE